MNFRALRLLLAAVALTFSIMPAIASSALDPSKPKTCAKPEYPRSALRRLDEGIALLGFLIRADGTVGRSVVLSSSGSADLDAAAVGALSKCEFKPATKDGQPVEIWVQVQYNWYIDGDPSMLRARHAAAVAAANGDVGARYRLAQILSLKPKTDADREDARTLAQSAAELGHAHAQYQRGVNFEKGKGVNADIEEALRWYQKAAAQGDVFAIQRLKSGVLPD